MERLTWIYILAHSHSHSPSNLKAVWDVNFLPLLILHRMYQTNDIEPLNLKIVCLTVVIDVCVLVYLKWFSIVSRFPNGNHSHLV